MAYQNQNFKSIARSTPKAPLSQMMGWFKNNKNAPSYSNRYSVQFTTPKIFGGMNGMEGVSYYSGKTFQLETGDNANLLNFYANNVNLPSRQVTTSSITNIGSAYNYATSSTFSQIQIDFTMPRSQVTRNIFERWIQVMSSDANQYTDYYDSYVCPSLKVFKWERGGGNKVPYTTQFLEKIKSLGIKLENVPQYKMDQLVGIYDMRNVFPFNIGSLTLTNESAATMNLSVGFYYERYRFYTDDKYDAMANRIATVAYGADQGDDWRDPNQNMSTPGPMPVEYYNPNEPDTSAASNKSTT